MLDQKIKTDAKNKATEWVNNHKPACPNCGLTDSAIVQDTKASRQLQYNKREGRSDGRFPDTPVVPIVCSGCGTTIKYYDDPVNTV